MKSVIVCCLFVCVFTSYISYTTGHEYGWWAHVEHSRQHAEEIESIRAEEPNPSDMAKKVVVIHYSKGYKD